MGRRRRRLLPLIIGQHTTNTMIGKRKCTPTFNGSGKQCLTANTAAPITPICSISILFAAALLCCRRCESFFIPQPPTRATFVSSSLLPSSTSSLLPSSTSSSFTSHDITVRYMIYAPPGSGYATPDDETSDLPDTYEPMMEYPGTMRPGRTPENMPYQDLPLDDDDGLPNPIPWPHFQQIEWHHRWDPPHPHPIPMEEFIELQGRWATPEMEAAMRAGMRREVRKRREQEETEKRGTLIVDDDEDDVNEIENDKLLEHLEKVELGDGVVGQLGTDEAVVTATSSVGNGVAAAGATDQVGAPNLAVNDDEADLDNFLLDLGLDTTAAGGIDDDDDDNEVAEDDSEDDSKILKQSPMAVGRRPAADNESGLSSTGDNDDLDLGAMDLLVSDEDDDDDEIDDTPMDIADLSDKTGGAIATSIDNDLGLSVNDDDDDDDLAEEGVSTVPLDNFGGDILDGEEDFFDSGFDFDDADGYESGDVW